MRIVYSFPHPLGSPGIGTIAAAQIRGLIDLGHEVWVYTTSSTADVAGARAIVETMAVRGRRVPHRVLGVDRTYHYHDLRVASALRSLPAGTQVVHCWPLASMHTFVQARKAGILAVREVPNTHTAVAYERARHAAAEVGLTMPAKHSHSFDGRRLAREEVEYRLAEVLLVPSPVVEASFIEMSFPRRKLARHQYGFDPERIPAPDACDARPGDRPLTAAFVGRCEPRKGLHHALRAWIDSGVGERGRFLVCGSFVPGYRDRIADLLGHPSVTELGFVGDIGTVLRDADILVFPSLEEGSALVTYEAQASGCVLLVSDASGALCPDPEQALVHRAGDVATLAGHIARVDQDRPLLARLRSATLAQREKLTWATAAGRVADIYASRLDDR